MKQAMKFTPYQKVLVRDTSIDSWRCDFYSYTNCTTHGYEYICVGGRHNYCIPYEGNEALVGTTDAPNPKRWRAENGGLYWALDINYVAYEVIEQYKRYDDKLYSVGNYFRTREEAEEMAVKFKALLVKEMLKGE